MIIFAVFNELGNSGRLTLAVAAAWNELFDLEPDAMNRIIPVAQPVPVRRLRLRSACHIRRAGANLHCAWFVHAQEKLPPLPTVPLPFSHQARILPRCSVDA
jgi:hypothetical protein